MGIVQELSSVQGKRTQEANERVARTCLEHPESLKEIVETLSHKNAQLVADCAEVLTKVAEKRPELVEPHAATLFDLIGHRNGRVRWESAHAFALVSDRVPRLVAERLPRLAQIIQEGEGVIVRDYAVDAVVGYATTGERALRRALPVLREALAAWEGKHAARIFVGLSRVIAAMPKRAGEVAALARGLEDHERAGVRKAARALLKLEGNSGKT
jgi:hypothetical protein